MRRVLAVAAILAAGAVAPAAAGATPDRATSSAADRAASSAADRAASSAGCSSVRYGGRGYVLYKRGVKCSWARRWVKRVHRTKEGPRKWRCTSGSDFRTGGYCERGAKHFGWHPGD
ncbi:MAG TPA: hypothetical protein VNO82_15605 [Solirubrobacteraceae bacterium]|nr:hypothetical protein [Solirubrobacteraceae bacterium]